MYLPYEDYDDKHTALGMLKVGDGENPLTFHHSSSFSHICNITSQFRKLSNEGQRPSLVITDTVVGISYH